MTVNHEFKEVLEAAKRCGIRTAKIWIKPAHDCHGAKKLGCVRTQCCEAQLLWLAQRPGKRMMLQATEFCRIHKPLNEASGKPGSYKIAPNRQRWRKRTLPGNVRKPATTGKRPRQTACAGNIACFSSKHHASQMSKLICKGLCSRVFGNYDVSTRRSRIPVAPFFQTVAQWCFASFMPHSGHLCGTASAVVRFVSGQPWACPRRTDASSRQALGESVMRRARK